MLELKHIAKTYKTTKGVRTEALKDINLRFPQRGMVFVLGKSGSGKSTLLNIIGGLDQADTGEIIINGKSSADFKQSDYDSYRNTYVGFIFQEYFLLDSLTVQENIAVPLTLIGAPSHKIDTMVQKLAERFGIASLLGKYPAQLSGGQRQRTAAARALIKSPDILFADEPTGALDSASAAALLKKLSEVNEALKTTILMVTHDAYAASFASRILIFKDGHITKALHRKEETSSHFYHQILNAVSNLDQ